MIAQLIGTAVQVAAVLAISLIVWALSGRKMRFAAFIGVIAPTPRAMTIAALCALVLVTATVGLFLLPQLHAVATGPNTVIGAMRASGFNAETLAMIVLVGAVKTALTEEIFFRGLIGKRLIRWLGFLGGNTLQALLFASVHMLIFLGPSGARFDAVIAGVFLFVTFAGGWTMGWLNERVGDGSIAPGWLLHGLANVISYPVLAFAT